jgi:hypothetical protein
MVAFFPDYGGRAAGPGGLSIEQQAGQIIAAHPHAMTCWATIVGKPRPDSAAQLLRFGASIFGTA